MHCEVVVPGLLAAARELRLPAVETLLARGRISESDPGSLESWLLGSIGLEQASLPAGALTLLAGGGNPGEAIWARADPIHLRLMRDRVIVVPSAAFSVSREEADALCATLNRHFAGRLELRVVDAERWCVRLAADLELPAGPSLQQTGLAIEPGRRADPLLNEMQMVLHEHPVNEAREARGEPAINSLWLWGSGRAVQAPGVPWRSISSNDPVALGLARSARIRGRALPASADAWLEHSPEDGRHLAVLDGLRAPLALSDAEDSGNRLQGLEHAWFAPLLAALRAGRAGMVTIHVPDAPTGVSFETIRADLRRFWRRRRPVSDFLQ